jgi:hypothetical protein
MSKKKEKDKPKSYIVGPFKEAMDKIDICAINMYYSYYYNDAIDNLIKVEEKAGDNMTIEDAEKRQEDLEFDDKILNILVFFQRRQYDN